MPTDHMITLTEAATHAQRTDELVNAREAIESLGLTVHTLARRIVTDKMDVWIRTSDFVKLLPRKRSRGALKAAQRAKAAKE